MEEGYYIAAKDIEITLSFGDLILSPEFSTITFPVGWLFFLKKDAKINPDIEKNILRCNGAKIPEYATELKEFLKSDFLPDTRSPLPILGSLGSLREKYKRRI